MKILIVDDEAPARDRLRRLVTEIGNEHEIVGDATNGIEAIKLYEQRQPELILMDIRMPGMDGLEAARHLSVQEIPPAIIFTTAYGDHALEAFKTHAVDYLLKPIRREQLETAIKAAKRMNRVQVGEFVDETKPEGRSHICVRQRGNLELVAIEDTYFFFAEHKYVTLAHKGGEVLIEESLISLEQEFGDRFLRIHRNCLVSVNELQGLGKMNDGTHRAILANSDQRPEVSRRHLSTVRKILRGKL